MFVLFRFRDYTKLNLAKKRYCMEINALAPPPPPLTLSFRPPPSPAETKLYFPAYGALKVRWPFLLNSVVLKTVAAIFLEIKPVKGGRYYDRKTFLLELR